MKNYYLLLVLGFSISITAQEKTSQKLIDISIEACSCISNIDIDASKEVKSEKIKDCITTSNLTYQLKHSLLGDVNEAIDSLSKVKDISKIDSLTIGKGEENTINVDENYKEIEEYLYENCPQMKQLYFTDNSEHDNSLSNKKKAMRFYDEGLIAFQNQDFEKAIILFKKSVRKDKKFAFAWDNLGYSYRKIGNYKEAINCYNKSLELDPKGKMPSMNIAVAYQLNGDNENAIKSYQKYKGYYSDDPEGFYGLGRIYYLEKNYEPALENMIQAYILYKKMNSPYNIDAQKHISFIYNELKELNKLDIFNSIAKKHNLTVNTDNN